MGKLCSANLVKKYIFTHKNQKTSNYPRYYDPETGSMKYNTSGDDFVMNSFKLPVEEFRREPRLALPFYDGEAWKERNDTWGGPRDVVSIPTGIFKVHTVCPICSWT